MNGKPNILIICNSFPPAISGVGQYVYNLTKSLKDKYNFKILTSNMSVQSSWTRIACLPTYQKLDGVEIISVRLLPPYLPYLLTYTLAMEAKKYIRSKLVNIVHVHSLGQLHSDASLLFAKKRSLRTVYTIHAWRNVEGPFSRLLLSIYEHSIAPRVLRSADIITVLGKRGQQYVQSILKCKGKKIEVVPNGIDFKRIRSVIEKVRDENFWKNVGIPDNKKILIYYGRLTRMKGLFDLILAFYQVHKLNRDVFLLIIGSGPLMNNLTTLINKLGLGGSCMITSATTYQLFNYLANSHLFVLPSYAEGMPTTILEAMAAEVPVIATNVGDVADIVIHGKTGLIVQPGNVQQLTNSILEILENGKLRRDLIKNGLEVARLHDWSLIAEKVNIIYERLLMK